MNKAKTYEYMSDYIDGNMTDEELQKFEKILSDNLDFKKEIEEIKSLKEKIRTIDSLRLPDSFDVKLKDSIHKLKTANRFNIFDNPIVVTMASIAAIFIFFTITTLFMSNDSLNDKLDNNGFGYNNDVAYEEEIDSLEEAIEEENYDDVDKAEGL